MKFSSSNLKANETSAFFVISSDGKAIGRVSSTTEVVYKFSNGNRYADSKTEKIFWSAVDAAGNVVCSNAKSRKEAASFLK